MDGKRLIRSIKLTNLLSFGPDGMEIELQPLNVLIGANGSGKSNFIESIRLLKLLPGGLSECINDGGGVSEWIWKGRISGLEEAAIEADFFYEERDEVLQYGLRFGAYSNTNNLFFEEVLLRDEGQRIPGIPWYHFQTIGNSVDYIGDPYKAWTLGSTSRTSTSESVFRHLAATLQNPAIEYIAQCLSEFQIYTYASLGRLSSLRKEQNLNDNADFLNEDGSNLAAVINDLDNQAGAIDKLSEKLGVFYDRARNPKIRSWGNGVVISLEEDGLTRTVPATRLSDGMLRYLCLLVLLLHPTPPPLMCIEEPELGMHPDILPTIAELLIDASQRTQLIVTTHSEMLVSAIGAKHPDAIVVCERTNKGTTMERLEPEKLAGWLKDYSLGEVWLKGAIGGTRW